LGVVRPKHSLRCSYFRYRGIGLSAIGLGALPASSWLGEERICVYKE
jgi:hypothetical protein